MLDELVCVIVDAVVHWIGVVAIKMIKVVVIFECNEVWRVVNGKAVAGFQIV